MNAILTHLLALPRISIAEPSLKGLQQTFKVFVGGQPIIIFEADADLDTDGVKNPAILHWDSDHQNQTSIDPGGSWFDSTILAGSVLPIGYDQRHGGIELGMPITLVYHDHVVHTLYFDKGPRTKIGETSVEAQEEMDEVRVANHRILNVGIDRDVYYVLHLGHKMEVGPHTTQADINAFTEPLWQACKGA